jgi:hypothetical protein
VEAGTGRWTVRATEKRTTTITVTTGVYCDVCRGKIRNKPYSVADVTIEAEEGECYPGGGTTELTEIDCCWRCWKAKVRPAIEALGVTFRTTEQEH